MVNDVKNTNIIISEVIDNGQQLKLRDQNRRTYSFFKTKKDGSETVAFRSYQNFHMGDAVEISFKEVPYKEGLIKNILNMKPATGPVEAPTMRNTTRQNGPNREYWEAREATRQNAILLQVAFKAAVSLEAARVQNGQEEDKDRLFSNTLEFYDVMATELGDGVTNTSSTQGKKQSSQENIRVESVPFED